MGAPQHQGANTGLSQLAEIVGGHQLGRRMIEPSFLDKRNEERAGPLHHSNARGERLNGPVVGITRNGAGGADYADRPALARSDGSASTRFDHPQHRYGGSLLQSAERVRRAGITGHHHGLDSLAQQPVKDLQAVALHGLRRLGAVRHPGGVAKVDGGLLRQALVDGPRNGETSDTRIEDADRRRIHGSLNGKETPAPAPPGTASRWRSPGKSAR